MRPGDWVGVTDYDDDEATSALVLSTSTHKTTISPDEAKRLISEAGRVCTGEVTWRSVVLADRPELGEDEFEFHEAGTGARWVVAALCVDSPYERCGGCGATHPEQRCLGCMHVFRAGDWPDRGARATKDVR